MPAKSLILKSFFMNEIQDLREEISSVPSQPEQERLYHSKNNNYVEDEENINEELIILMSERKSNFIRRN